VVFGERLVVVVENDEMPNVPVSVVVAVPVVKSEAGPQAKPLTVDEALPSAEIEPFRTIVEVETDVGSDVVTVGVIVS
jgi:hypothetical protein